MLKRTNLHCYLLIEFWCTCSLWFSDFWRKLWVAKNHEFEKNDKNQISARYSLSRNYSEALKRQYCRELIYVVIYKLNFDLLVDFGSLIFGEVAKYPKYHEFEKRR